MIRLLIIGRDAEQWRRELNHWVGKTLEVACETLPAAGIRNFSDNSPDAVAIAEPDESTRIAPIVEAIRERPLGRIVPVLLLGASFLDDEELHIASAVDGKAGGSGLVEELEAILGVDLEPDPRHAQTMEEPDLEVERSREGDQRTYESTEIPTVQDDGGTEPSVASRGARPPPRDSTGEGVVRGDRSESGAVEHPNYVIEPLDEGSAEDDPPSADGGAIPAAEAADIRRKLKEVRHEDYFVILEVRRSTDGEAVRRAYRELKARFHPERLEFDLAEKFEAELDEINDALDDARAVLGDERLRGAYLDGTTRR